MGCALLVFYGRAAVSIFSRAKGALGEHRRHDTDGIRLDIAAPGCRSNVRRSTDPNCPQAGQENDSHGSPGDRSADRRVEPQRPAASLPRYSRVSRV